MIEIDTVTGPLDEAGLSAIVDLYGSSDPKYSHTSFLRHLFIDNPYGWSVHAFARDGDAAVGHCAVIPVLARAQGRPTMSGKVEAFFVERAYRRGRGSVGEQSVAEQLLVAVSDGAEGRGVDPLHAYVSPHVGAIFERVGYSHQSVGSRAYAIVLPAAAADGDQLRRALVRTAAAGQGALAVLAAAATHTRARVEPVVETDADLVDIDVDVDGPADSWTVAGADSWDWFVHSGFLHALALSGSHGGRAIVSIEDLGKPVHLLGWKPRRPGLDAAAGLLAGLARFGRDRCAPSVRIQPWPGVGDDRSLARACRLMALAPREPFTLFVRSPSSPGPVEPSPFFYATF